MPDYSEVHSFGGIQLGGILVGIANLRQGYHRRSRALPFLKCSFLKPYSDLERMHISEAKALYVARAQILNQMGQCERATKVLDMLEDLIGEDSQITECRSMIEGPTKWPGFLRTLINR